jgi:hypothetical protein
MQWHYEFNKWEQAFAQFYRKRCGEELKDSAGRVLGFRKGDDSLVFIISTAPYVSGYWIEHGDDVRPDAETKVYRTVEDVKRLERRIRRQRQRTNSLSLGRVVT